MLALVDSATTGETEIAPIKRAGFWELVATLDVAGMTIVLPSIRVGSMLVLEASDATGETEMGPITRARFSAFAVALDMAGSTKRLLSTSVGLIPVPVAVASPGVMDTLGNSGPVIESNPIDHVVMVCMSTSSS